MRGARGLVLTFAVVAAGSAAMIVHRAAPVQPMKQPQSVTEMVDVLVAARSIPVGEMVDARNVRWQSWPKVALVTGSIERQPGMSASPLAPAPARYPILAGELVVESKLVHPNGGSVLASLVAPGMRAISVSIREDTAAGGLIQPQDRVDVVLTHKSREGGTNKSDILFRSAKVLAIGKILDARNTSGNRTVTLELPPSEVKRLAWALQTGDISLALVGTADKEQTVQIEATQDVPTVSVLRFGHRSEKTRSE
jgi:pilus assembly protein CpaB